MKKTFLLVFVLLSLTQLVSAEIFALTIRGELRTPEDQLDYATSAGISDSRGEVESDKTIGAGYFEVRNVALNSEQNRVTVFTTGGCFNHAYHISRINDRFEVTDAYAPEKGIILTSQSSNIDLGTLKEDKSNYIKVDSDEEVSFLAEDLSGNWVAETGASKQGGSFGNFKPESSYKITLENSDGEKWVRTITTGGYCEGTRIIKRGDYFVTENFPNNGFPRIGFFRQMGLWIRGVFS